MMKDKDKTTDCPYSLGNTNLIWRKETGSLDKQGLKKPFIHLLGKYIGQQVLGVGMI